MSSPHPIFDIAPPRQVKLCLTTQFQPRAVPLGSWSDCSPVGGAANLLYAAYVDPEIGLWGQSNRNAWKVDIAAGSVRDMASFTTAFWLQAFATGRPLVQRSLSYSWYTSLDSWYWSIRVLGTPYTATTRALSSGKWAHLAYTQSGTSTKGYVNGTKVIDVTSGTIPARADALYFGINGSNAPYANGNDFCYTDPLTDGQVRLLFERGRGRYGV